MKSNAEFRDLWLNDDIREPFDNCLDKYQVIVVLSKADIKCKQHHLIVNILLQWHLFFSKSPFLSQKQLFLISMQHNYYNLKVNDS